MGLGLLLTVSKTLRAARDTPHRYRASSRAQLPVFDGTFHAEHSAAAMKEEKEKSGEQAVQADPPAVGRTNRGEAPASGTQVQPARQAGSGKRWWNIASWFSGRGKPKQQTAKPNPGRRPERPAVQQELALENLKPCRNDLSDADWELAKRPVSGARLAFLKNLASSGSGESRSAASRAAAPAASEKRR